MRIEWINNRAITKVYSYGKKRISKHLITGRHDPNTI